MDLREEVPRNHHTQTDQGSVTLIMINQGEIVLDEWNVACLSRSGQQEVWLLECVYKQEVFFFIRSEYRQRVEISWSFIMLTLCVSVCWPCLFTRGTFPGFNWDVIQHCPQTCWICMRRTGWTRRLDKNSALTGNQQWLQ